ncbi:hypothetical protein [Candidatus Pyrohabitans sp.]
MPLREINRIESQDEMYINFTMKNQYDIRPGDVLVFEARRHFDERKRLIQEINQTFEVKIANPRWINFPRDLPEFHEKYRVKFEDYLEVVYIHLKRGDEVVEIFPGEMKEYLDFDPDKEED